MFKTVGCWEQGWNTPMFEFDLWTFPTRDFGSSEMIMCPISGIDRKVTEVRDVQEAIDNNPDLVPIFVEEDGETWLGDFKHPDNALYIFGKAAFSPWKSMKKNGISIKIETHEENGLLWAHQAACVVLYDRKMKNDSYSK